MSGEIQREEDDSKGRYSVVVEGHEAEMTYSRAGENLIIIDHTSQMHPEAKVWACVWSSKP